MAVTVSSAGVTFEAVTLSDVGKARDHNEDAVMVDVSRGLLLLADGMGGYMAGEVASKIAIDTVSARFPLESYSREALGAVDVATGSTAAANRLKKAIIEANQAIFEASANKKDQDGMGTTLVAGLIYGQTLCLGHVGDSRCYRWRDGQFDQITRDHSLVQDQIDAGLIKAEDAHATGYKNLVTRALGIDALTQPEINEFRIAVGDVYCLCSDGLTDMVKAVQIAALFRAGTEDLNVLAKRLIDAANKGGGRDNISVVLARITHLAKLETNWWLNWKPPQKKAS